MIQMDRQASQSSFENIMRMKRSARDEQVRAVYDADQSSLDLAAEQIKSVIRGVGSAAPRRQRISSLLLG